MEGRPHPADAMDSTSSAQLRVLGEAMVVMSEHLHEGAQRAVDDLGRVEGLLEEAEQNFEGHADMFYNIKRLWSSFMEKELFRRSDRSLHMDIPLAPQAVFIASVDSCLPHLRPEAAWALHVQLRSFLGTHTWEGMSQVVSSALDFIKEQAQADLMRMRSAECLRDARRLRRDQLVSEVHAVVAAGRAAELQLKKRSLGRADSVHDGPLPDGGRGGSSRGRGDTSCGRLGCSCGSPWRTRQAWMDLAALGRLRRGAAYAVRELERSANRCEAQLNEDNLVFLAAHKRFIAHSDFRCELANFFNSLEEGLLGVAVVAGEREELVAILRRHEPALTRDAEKFWLCRLRQSVDALSRPMVTPLLPVVRSWMDLLSRQMTSDLWEKGVYKAHKCHAIGELARMRSDCLAARLAELAFNVLSRQCPAELLPSWPAERLAAQPRAEFDPAESLPAESLPAERFPLGFAAAEFDPAESSPAVSMLAESLPAERLPTGLATRRRARGGAGRGAAGRGARLRLGSGAGSSSSVS